MLRCISCSCESHMVRFCPPCFCGVACKMYVFQQPHSTVLYTVEKIPLSLREAHFLWKQRCSNTSVNSKKEETGKWNYIKVTSKMWYQYVFQMNPQQSSFIKEKSISTPDWKLPTLDSLPENRWYNIKALPLLWRKDDGKTKSCFWQLGLGYSQQRVPKSRRGLFIIISCDARGFQQSRLTSGAVHLHFPTQRRIVFAFSSHGAWKTT